jgi:hypothetical protein
MALKPWCARPRALFAACCVVVSLWAVAGAEPAAASPPPSGGYWLAAANGGVLGFGSAVSYGSPAGSTLNAPIVGITASADGMGYWTAAADGGVFSFGDALFMGSMGGKQLNAPSRATGWWRPTVVSSRSGAPRSWGRWEARI